MDALKPFRNQVFQEDILKLLGRLPPASLDFIYGDPDYNVGVSYAGRHYNKKWDAYIDWYCELTAAALRVLKPTGNLFLINYPKQNAYLRVKYLDNNAHAVQDYAWVYNTNVGHSRKRFTTAHRSILHATKSKNNHFYKNQVAVPYKNLNDKRIQARLAAGHKGAMPYNWFYFNLVKNVNKDKTFHACQIPLPLVTMLIQAATRRGDDCCILFGGSGNELLLCRSLERNFISAELHPQYYKMIKQRLRTGGKIAPEHRLPANKTQAQYDYHSPAAQAEPARAALH